MLRFIFGDHFEYLRCRKKSLQKILSEYEKEMKQMAADLDEAHRQRECMPVEEMIRLDMNIGVLMCSIQAIRRDIKFTRKQMMKEVFKL